jgi:hypothetical protein
VKRNLVSDGLFIVGDEFLMDHNERSRTERDAALRTYHQYIIDCATREQHPQVASLEAKALESGLNLWGDFKMSCRHYEQQASASGLSLVSKEKIGPLDNDKVGGIYVYAFRSA